MPFTRPIVSDFTEESTGLTCAEINCDDSNPCTNDSCQDATCFNIPLADGASCGLSKVCSQGNCVDSQMQQVGGEVGDNNLILWGVVLVILIGLGYFLYSKR